jgi:hypothetical protein
MAIQARRRRSRVISASSPARTLRLTNCDSEKLMRPCWRPRPATWAGGQPERTACKDAKFKADKMSVVAAPDKCLSSRRTTQARKSQVNKGRRVAHALPFMYAPRLWPRQRNSLRGNVPAGAGSPSSLRESTNLADASEAVKEPTTLAKALRRKGSQRTTAFFVFAP